MCCWKNVCDNYMKCIQMIKETDLEEVCSHIYHAKRLFAYGTGETQHAVTQMIKRMFMNVKRIFCDTLWEDRAYDDH